MNALENIENLVQHLAGSIEGLIDERDDMLAEISGLRERLMERDKEAVKAVQDMGAELEEARMKALRFEQEQVRTDTRLKGLNDRLTALVEDVMRYGG
jgi:chromosome segregation ATPase